ncbi:MAG TPA: hypothetical protein VH307_21105 [Streptosporangiaceae bacterium]|nr:hypothetical protein [Streptosporangiaceae bacterium]
MSVFIEVVAWIIITFAAVPIVITLVYLEAGLHARKQRHGRATTIGEAWPDIRNFLPCVAIGVSLLGHQWRTDTAGWWLAQIPLFAFVTLYLAAWIRSLLTGRPGTSAADREIRGYLLAFAAVTPLLTYQWIADTAGWWLMDIPVLAAGAVSLEAGIRYLMRRKPGGPTAEPS